MTDLCECHGEPKYMLSPGKGREKVGVCAVLRRERKRRYARSERGRETNRAAAARWRATHFRLKIGSIQIGSYPCTPEQRERIRAFRKEQDGLTATP